ncbi:hypothetical protein ACOMHN_059926 [Nucella lapillus]
MMTMAASGSDSFSSGSILSDTDLETINSEELVIFHSTHTAYSNRNDIVVVYSSGNAVSTSPKDWIGLFKTGWQTMYDFSAFQWVPFNPLRPFQPNKRRTIFPQADIEDILGRFQFLYITGDNDVIGVSDSFDVCGVDIALEYNSFAQERIPSSLSLISLGSLSSSSDDNTSWELTSEKTDVAEETHSNSASAEMTALVPRKDYWTLSDFVVGSRVEGLFQKLRFVQPYDWVTDCDPSKSIYLSADHRKIIEEIQSKGPELSSGQTATSSDVVGPDSSGSSFSPLFLSGPLVFTYCPETISSQISFLQMYHPRLLMSAVEETDSKVPAAASKDKEALAVSVYRKWTLPDCKASQKESSSIQQIPSPITGPCVFMDKRFKQCSRKTRERELGDHSDLKFNFKWRKPNENNEGNTQSVKAAQPETVQFCGTKTGKQTVTKPGENIRKKRWVQRSNIKNNRDKHEVMLQQALTLLSQPSSSSDSHLTHQQEKPEQQDSLLSSPVSHSNESSRKRHRSNAPGISKAKRRRLTRTSTPIPHNPHNEEEDEGYCSLGEEDNNGIGSNHAEGSLQLLNLALTEALKENAELRAQLKQATNKQSTKIDPTGSSSAKVEKTKVSPCEKAATSGKAVNTEQQTATSGKAVNTEQQAATSGKAVNTEKQKTCDAAANTKPTARKDSLVQCSKRRKGKATNTDRKSERHAASNTAALIKTDAPSQCVTRCVKSVNTLPLSSTQDASNNTPQHCHSKSLTPRRRGSLERQSEIIPLDLTVNRIIKLPETAVDDHLSEWKKVSSKRMVRLQKLILKKRQEFSRLRDNAENYEKKTHALENNLQYARSDLSIEKAKRLNAENELRELRIKFWELLAFRRSQPWGNRPAKQTPCTFALNEKPKDPKLSIASEPDLAEKSKNRCAETVPKERSVTPREPNPQPENKENVHEIVTEISRPKKSPACTFAKESKTKKYEGHGDNSDHPTLAADKRKPRKHIPVLGTAKINGVPMQVAEVKKATCGAISFKKFIMPAMTALAETFSSSSSKSRSKTSTTDEPTSNTSTTTVSSKSSSNAFAKVTVSISAGIPSAKSSSKHQKTCSKNKSSKRSSSRSKEKPKVDSSKTPCQETFPDSSSDIALCQRYSAAHPKLQKPDSTVLPYAIALPFPKADSSDTKNADSVNNNLSENGREKREETLTTEKWLPLNIPAKTCTGNDDEAGDVTAPSVVQPVNVCLTKPNSAGKGRPFSSTDTATAHPPRALHFELFGSGSNDAVGRQIQQGRCRTCGMKFAPSVDRYLVEEHLYFHHAFTE